jgi:hypothetical protein
MVACRQHKPLKTYRTYIKHNRDKSPKDFVFQFASQKFNIKKYRSIILPVILCGCETWPLTWTKQHRLSVIENRALRKILMPKRDEVIEE